MEVSTRKTNETTIVELKGAVDLYSSPQARKAILGSIEDNKPKMLMINLSGVSYIDSSGVATLVEGLQLAKQRKCEFCLVALSPNARDVLELARLEKVFKIHATEADALKSIGS